MPHLPMLRPGVAGRTLAVVLLILSIGAPARAGGIAPDLQSEVRATPLLSLQSCRVIVRFKVAGVEPLGIARGLGGQLVRELPLVNGAVLRVPKALIPVLAANPAVDWISPDRPVKLRWDHAAEASGARQVWLDSGHRGSGVRVAVLDTGVTVSPEWTSPITGGDRIVVFKDLVNGQLTPYDDNGHGTHVAGIALGSGVQSKRTVSGAAPDAGLVAVKVLGEDGSGLVSTVIAGLDWCIQNRSLYNIGVINLSLGHAPAESAATDPLCAAVRRAVQAGIVVVCSAGNRGRNASGAALYGGIDCPGNEPSAITVGALNTHESADRADDTVCSYSSRGPTYLDLAAKPDLLAPGNQILSVRAPGSYLDQAYPESRVRWSPAAVQPEYFRMSGTSMAAPQVAGIAALMLNAKPALRPKTVKAILMYTAQRLNLQDAAGQPLPLGLSVLTQGAGSVNAAGAVALARAIDLNAPVGSAWMQGAPAGVSYINSAAVAWAGQVLWCDGILSGTDAMRLHQSSYTDDGPWGAPSGSPGGGGSWGGDIQWNDNEVPQNQLTWSDHSVYNDTVAWSESDMLSGEP